ncbi:MAG: ankyrin repeat domain-containing protein [Legionella sp.]|uniref:ankyrin repeat domain-containing protein n=1 Tax=Legionella sp. TaxID=459 RepID=UPI00283DAB0E|nr:ankyrin repeat domain-containing protein [Legionella sp.]
MNFKSSPAIFKAIESKDMKQFRQELKNLTSEKVVLLQSGLVRAGNISRNYNLLEACCLTENESALQELKQRDLTWSEVQLKRAAELAARAKTKSKSLMTELLSLKFPDHEALMAACSAGNNELIQTLLEKNNNINKLDPGPIMNAASGGFISVLQTLSDFGFDIQMGNDEALCLAVRHRQHPCVDYLIANGANVSAQRSLPLKIAISIGDIDVVKKLLDKGADLKPVAEEEFVSQAERHGHTALANFLRQKMVTMNIAFPLNIKQSTHISSVDRTVAESILRLKKRYGERLSADDKAKTLIDLTAWAQSLDGTNATAKAAQRAVDSILNGNPIIQEETGVSLKELLVFFWMAIHDALQRKTSIADGLDMLQEGLYELQRGYNLSNKGVDLGGDDEEVCEPGMFNKLAEKLVTISSDVEIDFITKEVASLKLNAVVREVALSWYKANVLLVNGLFNKNYDVEPIWNKIREQVKQKMFDEFSSLFSSYDDPEFNAFIDAGIDADIRGTASSTAAPPAEPSPGM